MTAPPEPGTDAERVRELLARVAELEAERDNHIRAAVRWESLARDQAENLSAEITRADAAEAAWQFAARALAHAAYTAGLRDGADTGDDGDG